VKRVDKLGRDNPGSMSAAHHLTGDYFTIHSKRDRSPVSVVDGVGTTARPSSFISYPSTIDADEPPKEVKDIGTLLKALKYATIDREKIDIVKTFVNQAGDELAYLQDHLSDDMAFFVFSKLQEAIAVIPSEISQRRTPAQATT